MDNVICILSWIAWALAMFGILYYAFQPSEEIETKDIYAALRLFAILLLSDAFH
jgi:hypothetical protein